MLRRGEGRGRGSSPSKGSIFRQSGAFLLVLLIALFVVHRWFWVDPDCQKVVGGHDNYLYFGALNYFSDYWFREGEIPLWNPMVLCGTPMIGNPQTLQFYPPNVLRTLLSPGCSPLTTIQGLAALSFLHIVWAGLGTYLLARRHNLGHVASSLAGFVYCSAPIIACRVTQHGHILMLCSWLPWILLSVNLACRSKSWRYSSAFALIAGLCSAVSFLAGFIDTSLYLGVTTLVYVVALGVDDRMNGDGAVPFIHTLARGTFVLSIVGIVTICCSAILLVPALVMMPLSPRGAEAGYHIYHLECLWHPYAGHPAYWDLGYFLRTHFVFGGAHGAWREMRGAGVGVFMLCVLAVLGGRKRPSLWIFVVVFLVLTDCSMGSPMPVSTLLKAGCPWELGWPSRATAPLALTLAMLAGIGLECSAEVAPPRKRAVAETAVLVGVGLGCLGVVWRFVGDANELEVSSLAFLAPLVGLILLVGARSCQVLGESTTQWLARRRAALLAFIFICVLVEIATWMPPLTEAIFEKRSFPSPERQALATRCAYEPTNSRGVGRWSNEDIYRMRPVYNGYEPFGLVGVRELIQGLDSDTSTDRELIRTIDARRASVSHHYGNLLFKRRFWLAREYVSGTGFDTRSLFPPTVTTYLPEGETPAVPNEERTRLHAVSGQTYTHYLSIPPDSRRILLTETEGQRAVRFAAGKVDIGSRHSCLTMTYTSTCKARVNAWVLEQGVSKDPVLLTELEARPRDVPSVLEWALPDIEQAEIHIGVAFKGEPGEFRILEACVQSDLNDEDSLISFVSDTPNEVTVEVRDLPGPRILTYLDADFPGWTVTVDGEKAQMLHPLGLFKGVELSPGTHRVTFAFRPRYFYAAAMVSVASALTAAIAAAILFLWAAVSTRARGAGLRA